MAELVDFNTHTLVNATADNVLGNKVLPGQDCELSAFRVRVGSTGGSSTITVKVWNSDGSTELASGSLTQTFTADTDYDISLSSPIVLTSGVTYWFAVHSTDAWLGFDNSEAAPDLHSGGGFEFNRTGAASAGSATMVFPTTARSWCIVLSPHVAATAITAALIPATETDSAQPVRRTKRKAIATVTETDTAPVFARQKSKALAPALETDTAPVIETGGIRVAIATVTETDEAPAITRTDPNTFRYRLTFPTYPRSFQTVPIGQTVRFVLDQAVSIVRQGGTLRQFRSPSQTQLEAAGTEGVDWFIGGRIYDQIPNDVAVELRLAGFETERVT